MMIFKLRPAGYFSARPLGSELDERSLLDHLGIYRAVLSTTPHSFY